VKSIDDWYKLTKKDLIRYGASHLLAMCKRSLYRCLLSVYKHTHWQPWRFEEEVPSNFWEDDGNRLEFFSWIREYLHDNVTISSKGNRIHLQFIAIIV
jgi:hypothetical protein